MTAPDRDETITYPTPNYLNKTGRCRMRVWWRGRPTPLVILTELDDNPSASITNAAEQVHAKVQRLHPGAVVVEHYHRSGIDYFSHVTVTKDEANGRTSTEWRPIHPELLPEVTDTASAS